MAYGRRSMSRKSSRSNFRKGTKVHRKNLNGRDGMRGGYRI